MMDSLRTLKELEKALLEQRINQDLIVIERARFFMHYII